ILGSAPISSFPTLSIVTTGDIRVEASGTTKGKIDVSGSAQGGIITLAALGAMQVDGNLLAKGTQTTAYGGEIDLLGLCVGGPSDLEAGGDATISGPLNVNGGGLSGDAGSVTITANGAVSVGGAVSGNAGGSTTEGGGTGADIEITAVTGSLSVTAAISADSGFPDGSAGEIDLSAGTDLLQTAPISAAGRGTDATGGDVTPDAGRNLTLTA